MEARKAAPECVDLENAARDDGSVLDRAVEYRLYRGKGGGAYSLVHDGVQRLDDVKVDVIVVLAKASFAPWDRAGKRT